MKKLIYGIFAISMLTALAGCEKEIKTYDGVEGLYFDVQWGAAHGNYTLWAHQIYTPLEFGKYAATDSTVQVKVMAVGETKDYDRPFTVVINQENTKAELGKDYNEFDGNGVIKAGETCGYVYLTVNRTEKMKTDTVRICLQLLENEYFELPFTSFGDVPGRWPDIQTQYMEDTDPRFHNIFATDILSKPEKWWGGETGGGTWGKWTAKKFQLMMDLTNTTAEDYTTEKMPLARATVIKDAVLEYLNEQMKNGTPVLEDDETYMWMNGATWEEGSGPNN